MAPAGTRRTHPLVFFGLAYGWAWMLWAGSILFNGRNTGIGLLLLAAGGFGPSLAAIFLTYVGRGASPPSEFWSRAFDPRRLTRFGVLSATFTIVVTIAAAILYVWGGPIPWLVKPAGAIGLLGTSLVLGPLAEELGWRGYALEPMQQRFGAPAGNTILGLVLETPFSASYGECGIFRSASWLGSRKPRWALLASLSSSSL